MIDYLTDPDRGVVEFTVDGPLTKEDYDRIVAEIDDAIGRFGKLRLVEIVKDIGRIDNEIWWPDPTTGATTRKEYARLVVRPDKRRDQTNTTALSSRQHPPP